LEVVFPVIALVVRFVANSLRIHRWMFYLGS
jgi:hypothetical protein